MYVSPISMRFVRGRSTPEIRAIVLIPAAACASGCCRSRARHHGGARTLHLSQISLPTLDLHSLQTPYSPLTTSRRPVRDLGRSASTPLEPDPRRSRGRNCVPRDSPGAPSLVPSFELTRTSWLGRSSTTTPSAVLSGDRCGSSIRPDGRIVRQCQHAAPVFGTTTCARSAPTVPCPS
jgi:hypothetical protein